MGNHLHEVCLLVYGPTFVQNHIFDTLLRSEIDVILISLVVDTSLEVHTRDVPVVPPVPSHLTGTDPRNILHTAGRTQDIAQVVLGHINVLAAYHGDAPGEGAGSLNLCYIVEASLHKHLQVVVSALLNFVGIGSIDATEATSVSNQIKTRIVLQMSLCDTKFHTFGRIHHQRKETVTLTVELAQVGCLVIVLKRVLELSLGRVVGIEMGNVGNHTSGVACKLVFHAFAQHLKRFLLLAGETVADTVVISTELNRIVTGKLQSQHVAVVLHSGLTCEGRSNLGIDLAAACLLHLGSLSPGFSCAELHADCRRSHYLLSVYLHIVGKRLTHLNIGSDSTVWRLQFILFLCSHGQHAHEAQQNERCYFSHCLIKKWFY